MIISVKKLIALLIGIIVLALVPVLQAELPATNEQFVSNSIARVVASFIDSLQLAPSRIKVASGSGLNNLAVDGAIQALNSLGWSIVKGNTQNRGYKYEINTTLSALDFKYTKGKSRGFFKRPFIRRELAGQTLLNLSGPDFNYVGFLDFSDSDKVLPQHENYIASIRYNELAPSAPVGGVGRYLEPLAVTATVGGLIYLFFVNR